MNKKQLIGYLAAVGLVFVFGTFAFGQIAPVRGSVKLQQANGTKTPFEGATVEPIRIDVDQGVGAATKTDKNGEFSFAGFPVGQKFTLAVSGPGIAPTLSQTVQGGM